jgi:hypothetical protein
MRSAFFECQREPIEGRVGWQEMWLQRKWPWENERRPQNNQRSGALKCYIPTLAALAVSRESPNVRTVEHRLQRHVLYYLPFIAALFGMSIHAEPATVAGSAGSEGVIFR